MDKAIARIASLRRDALGQFVEMVLGLCGADVALLMLGDADDPVVISRGLPAALNAAAQAYARHALACRRADAVPTETLPGLGALLTVPLPGAPFAGMLSIANLGQRPFDLQVLTTVQQLAGFAAQQLGRLREAAPAEAPRVDPVGAAPGALQALLDQAGAGYAVLGADGRLAQASDAFAALLGMSAESLDGASWDSLLDAEARQAWQHAGAACDMPVEALPSHARALRAGMLRLPLAARADTGPPWLLLVWSNAACA